MYTLACMYIGMSIVYIGCIQCPRSKASKAFDRVHYGKLFKLLRDRNLPAVVIRLLLDTGLAVSSGGQFIPGFFRPEETISSSFFRKKVEETNIF